jgi:hypothetical protein
VFIAIHASPAPDDSAYRLSEIACHDLLSMWLLGEDDISSLAAELLPPSSFSRSTGSIFPQKSHSVACFAHRFRHSVFETNYFLIEW